jgi:hypothetical protein
LTRDLGLDEALAGRERAGEDPLAQGVSGGFRERRAGFERLESGGGGHSSCRQLTAGRQQHTVMPLRKQDGSAR